MDTVHNSQGKFAWKAGDKHNSKWWLKLLNGSSHDEWSDRDNYNWWVEPCSCVHIYIILSEAILLGSWLIHKPLWILHEKIAINA
jgi:hypothetical protein